MTSSWTKTMMAKKLMWFVWSVVLYTTAMLLSMDLSTATYSPHQHPQQRQPLGGLNSLLEDDQHHPHGSATGFNHGNWNVSPGGSTMLQSPPSEREPEPQQHQSYETSHHSQPLMLHRQHPPQPGHQQDAPFYPPKISLKHVSMALRLTSEWNRRLVQGVTKVRQWGMGRMLQIQHQNDHHELHPQQQQQQEQLQEQLQEQQHRQYQEQDSPLHHVFQPYGDLPVNVHPTRSWQPPIQERPLSAVQEEELTIFHARTPRESPSDLAATGGSPTATSSSPKGGDGGGNEAAGGCRPGPRGVSHWGPDLLPFLERVVDLLDVGDGLVEVPLAMIYMDRAVSVETARSSGVPACPYCTPRTVHRLSLAALLAAVQAVRGEEQMGEAFDRLSPSLGIPRDQLKQMVDWMRAALGDAGLVVTVAQMREWSRSWEAIFSGNDRLQTEYQQQQQQRQLQQLELEQREDILQQLEEVPPQSESYQPRQQQHGIQSFVGQHHSYY